MSNDYYLFACDFHEDLDDHRLQSFPDRARFSGEEGKNARKREPDVSVGIRKYSQGAALQEDLWTS